MAIPKEAVWAAFPPAPETPAGKLQPPTLIHIFAMAALDHPVLSGGDDVSPRVRCEILVILKMTPDEIEALFVRGIDRARICVSELVDRTTIRNAPGNLAKSISDAVTLLHDAMGTMVMTKDPNAGEEVGETKIDNWGWPLVLAEYIMHQYQVTWQHAVRMPLVRLFPCKALADISRNGRIPAQPSFGERAYIDRIVGDTP
jgi:hypothetical protein